MTAAAKALRGKPGPKATAIGTPPSARQVAADPGFAPISGLKSRTGAVIAHERLWPAKVVIGKECLRVLPNYGPTGEGYDAIAGSRAHSSAP